MLLAKFGHPSIAAPPVHKPRFLIADDDAEIRALLTRYFNEQGVGVRVVADAVAAERLLSRERFDVLVLDIMMPGEDGLSLCRRLRSMGETIPILMLTARGDPVDRIIGLEMGADDYLPKPFNPRELLARLQAMVRRQRLLGAHGGPLGDEVVHFGDYALYAARRQLHKHGEPVSLTTGEFTLLHVLVMHANRPLGRDRLIELAKGRDHDVTERSIDAQVMRLRRAIEDDPGTPRYIQTVWGVGYVFVPDKPRSAASDAGH